MKDRITALIDTALSTLVAAGELPAQNTSSVKLDRTRDPSHGDLACNIALVLAKQASKPPRELAAKIIAALPENNIVVKTDIAGPGFINFFLNEDASAQVVKDVLNKGKLFGHSETHTGRKVQVEFVSANPTGPLHVGHGRGAAVGDSICRLLAATGWEVTAEFYYNDAGQQIDNLALSVQCRCKGISPEDPVWPKDGYRGSYIAELAQSYMQGDTVLADNQQVTACADIEDLEAIRIFAVAYLRREQDTDLKAFDVSFDHYFLESSLYKDGKVEETVKTLINNGYTYEKDGALWLKTTEFGDDKDRVMRKTDGGYTYFVPDVAYHLDKWQRGFERVVNEQGADHHSTVTRVRAGLQAAQQTIPDGWPDYVLHQMVLVTKSGEEVKISKRAGSYVTLRDLIDQVGRDATRYFLVARAANSQLTFDIDLARSQTNDNPVYYIQYAHARICSVFRKLANHDFQWNPDKTHSLNLLKEESEKVLLRKLSAYPEVIANAAKNCEPHNVANYLKELAGQFHSYYNAHKVLINDADLRDARLSLSAAIQQVLGNGLELLGISAPEEM